MGTKQIFNPLSGGFDSVTDNNNIELTGIPTAPTAAPLTNNTQLATTAYTDAAVAAGAGESVTAVIDQFTGDGIETEFTLSVTPSAVSNIDVFIQGVRQETSEYSLSGDVVTFTTAPLDTLTIEVKTYVIVGDTLLLNSPIFTGTPTAPTPTSGDDSSQIATTAFVTDAIAAAGGGGGGKKTFDMKLNGAYGGTAAYTGIDGLWIAPSNCQITNVFLYQEIGGTAGTTDLDLKIKPFASGSFTSIFSTTPKVDSTASDDEWCGVGDSNTGFTAPILTSLPFAVAEKSAIRMDLIGSQTGSAAGVGLLIVYEEL